MLQTNLSCSGEDIDDVWVKWYHKLTENVNLQDSRDGAVVGEVINAITVIKDPTRCILRSPIRKLPMRYMIGELIWYAAGVPTLDAIRLYTGAWDRMSDDGIYVNSNYGFRIQHAVDEAADRHFDQLRMVEELLRKDPATRQAVIHIKQARDLVNFPTKDVNCTVCLQFFIREEKLYCTTYMRSNDLWMGFPNDVFQFTAIQTYLAMRLGVGLGTYTHIAGSLHLYERNYKTSLENIEKYADTSVEGVAAIKEER